MENKNIDINLNNTSSNCIFCHGTGIAKCFNLQKLDSFPDGTYNLKELKDKYGEYTECPEGCNILN